MPHVFLLCLKKTTHKYLKVAAAETIFSNVCVIGKPCFSMNVSYFMWQLEDITILLFMKVYRYFETFLTAMLLPSLKPVFEGSPYFMRISTMIITILDVCIKWEQKLKSTRLIILFCYTDVIKLEAVIQRCFVKKVFLEISQNSQESTCASVSFLIKLQALLKKKLWHRYFPVNFVKFLRTVFTQNTSGGCFCQVFLYDIEFKTWNRKN